MKYAYVAAGLIAAASAQTVADLPACSLQCVISAVTGTGCSVTDYACACPKADQLTASVTPCVQKACTSTADQEKVITVLSGICKNAGFPITISATPSSAAVSTTTATASATGSSIASASTTETTTASTTATNVTVVTSTSTTAAGGSACASSSVKTVSTNITTVIATVMYETMTMPCATTTAANTTSVAATSAPSQVTAGAAANSVALGAGFVALLAMAL